MTSVVFDYPDLKDAPNALELATFGLSTRLSTSGRLVPFLSPTSAVASVIVRMGPS